MPRSGFLFLACGLALLPADGHGEETTAGPAAADKAAASKAADACAADMHRLCDSFFPDEKRVATCLIDRRAELSRPCAEVLASPDAAADDGDDAN